MSKPQTTPALRVAQDAQDGDQATIEGWLVPFDGPYAGDRDSYGTRFSARTDYALDLFGERPLLWHHGLDPATGISPVGRIRSLEVREKGVWMRGWLDRQSEYFDSICQMAEEGKVFLSSGALDYLVKINARTGDVERWPIAEGSMTLVPSNFYATIDTAIFRSAIRSAGIGLDAAADDRLTDGSAIVSDYTPLRALWSTTYVDSLPDSSFAYVEDGADTDKSKRHLPYKDREGQPDAAHVRNALVRLDQTDIPTSAKASAKRTLLAVAKEVGVDTGDKESNGDSARAACIDCGGEADPFLRYAERGGRDLGSICRRCATVRDTARRAETPTETPDSQPLAHTRSSLGAALGEYERSYEDIRQDIGDLLNANRAVTGYWSICETFPTYVIACQYPLDDDGYVSYDDDDMTYWRVAYTLNDQSEPDLGAMQQVEQVYQPVDTDSARAASFGPLWMATQLYVRHGSAVVERTKDLDDRRSGDGRCLSPANLRALDHATRMVGGVHQAFVAAQERAVARAEEAARAARLSDPAEVQRQLDLIDMWLV